MNSLQDFITERVKLPSPPAVAIKILQAIRKNDNSFEELSNIIMTDPALAARVLKIANSSLYGVKGQVKTLRQATTLIGTNVLRNIALSFVIMDKFKISPQESFDIEHFWKRSVTSAVAAEILADKMSISNQDIFISALLQDIGVLILFLSQPAKYTEMRDQKRLNNEPTHMAEKRIFGHDHCEIGGKLLHAWNLPKTIYQPIIHHHTDNHNGALGLTPAILRLSGIISGIFNGVHSTSKAIDIQQQLLKDFGWSADQIIETIDTIGDKARELLRLFQIDPGETMPLSHIMQDIIDELGRLNLSYEQVILELQQAKHNAEQLAMQLKKANDSLRELAYRDGLTGLYNHRYFQEVLQAELDRTNRYKHPLSLLLIDIDYFKKVNDTYGHQSGDLVLREVSRKLTQLVRKNDLVARYGGEEFTIILPETSLPRARIMAQRIRRGIEQHRILLAEETISVTISIGLVSTEGVKEKYHRSALIDIGDQALYRAKQLGRNRVEL